MARPPKNAGKPVAVRKDSSGKISHVLFENRTKMTPQNQAVNMTKNGLTKNIRVNKTANGKEYVQDKPDSSTADNLQNLPEK